MSAIKLYDRIVLTQDLPDSVLRSGDVGTVVEIYNDGEAYEIEFFVASHSLTSSETMTARENSHNVFKYSTTAFLSSADNRSPNLCPPLP